MQRSIAAVVFAFLAYGAAHAETCMKAGEESSGLGKVCTYNCTFGQTTLNVGAASICPLTTRADPRAPSSPGAAGHTGGVCMKVGENTVGMTKQCVYDCTGTRKVLTIGAVQLCPLTAH